MSDSLKELSSRYFWAERGVWLLGANLIAFSIFGEASVKAIPIIQISPKEAEQVPRVIAVLLFFLCNYMVFEWRTSLLAAKSVISNRWRLRISLLSALICLLLSYSKLVEKTIFAEVSFLWFVAVAFIGYAIGVCLSRISVAALMIRTPEQAIIVGLPRLPIASRAQFLAWGPVTLILFAVYYMLIFYCPDVAVSLLSILSSCSFLWVILFSLVNFIFYYDSEGNHLPYRTRLESFRDIHNKHDYMHFVSDMAVNSSEWAETFSSQTPETSQNILRDKIARGCIDGTPNYRGILLDEISFKFNDQNEDTEVRDDNYRAISISVSNESNIVRLRVIHFDPEIPPVDYIVDVDILERHADHYLRSLSDEECFTINPEQMMNYVLQKTIEEVMTEKNGGINALLELFIERGDSPSVAKLLKRKTNLNIRGVAGWTPLLHASANGYEDIVRLLLDGGANPDIANDLGITPLMFGARYSNLALCALLVDFGAEINIQNNTGGSALMKACEIGNLEIVKLLLEHGAKLELVDMGKQNALAIAHASGQGAVASYLRRLRVSRELQQ